MNVIRKEKREEWPVEEAAHSVCHRSEHRHTFQIHPDLPAPPLLLQQFTCHKENEPTPTPWNLSIAKVTKALQEQAKRSLEVLRSHEMIYNYQRN